MFDESMSPLPLYLYQSGPWEQGPSSVCDKTKLILPSISAAYLLQTMLRAPRGLQSQGRQGPEVPFR